MLQIITRIVFNHLVHGIDYSTIRQHRFKTKYQSPGHAIANHFSTAGIGRYIAANLATTSSTQIQRHKQAVFGGGILQHLQRGSSPGTDGHGRGINILDPIHALKGDSKFSLLRGCTPCQTSQSPLNYHRLIVLMAQSHNLRQFIGGFGL